MLEKPVFPTMFYETKIDGHLAFAILEEIKTKQNQIDTVSEATQIIPVSDYSTDFVHSIRIDSFWDCVVPGLQLELSQFKLKMENIHSWVSCYTGPYGHHPLHNHHGTFTGKVLYSGILYLTRVGATDFFNIDPTSQHTQYQHAADIGSIVLFPSIIPHQYNSSQFDGNARYTLPFNFELVSLT